VDAVKTTVSDIENFGIKVDLKEALHFSLASLASLASYFPPFRFSDICLIFSEHCFSKFNLI
jgi:hypothetical protein